MVSDAAYELCLPVLDDDKLEEEEKTEKLEEILRKETSLTGRPLQEAILRILWRYRDVKEPPATSPPPHNRTARQSSPAPWQSSRATTPLASPPLTGTGSSGYPFGVAPPSFTRSRSYIGSPFESPRPSPSLAVATPLPHSPNLNSYEFSDPMASQADYGDYGSDAVDWLVNDDSPSRPSSSGAGSAYESNLNASAMAWVQPQQTEMSPYDMLRSVLGDGKSDEEIEAALEVNGYDLSATLMQLMEPGTMDDTSNAPNEGGQVLIGKSMLTSQPISITQGTPPKSSVICKYWLSTGSCLRADCRFSHDLSSHVCKYWIMGNCLAGDSCVFSHDPTLLLNNMNLGNSARPLGQSPNSNLQPSFQIQDYDAFPNLQATMTAQWAQRSASPNALYNSYNSNNGNNYPGPRAFAGNAQEFRPGSRGRPSNIALESQSPRLFNSRPSSRHSARSTTPSIPAVDDTEAFPTLGSALAAKGAKKHHGKRGGHSHASHNSKENIPNSLADVVRMSPSPVPGLLRKGLVKMPSYTGASTKETNTSSAAAVIPPPEQIPWLETGEKVNSSYLKARQEAFKHGGLRNKFLQSAAQAWNRNDARAAKALSLRGQSENELMRKSHREAARLLYESRNSSSSLAAGHELYVDLHGLHPEEAIEYLEQVLAEQKSQASLRRDEGEGMKGNERILYAITGTGHHSKGGKDKVGKAVRGWLAEGGWIFREFSVAGDRGNVGGVLGVDIKSGGKTVARTAAEKGSASGEVSSIATESAAANSNATNGEDGEGNDNGVPDEPEGESLGSKVRLVKNIPTGPRRRG